MDATKKLFSWTQHSDAPVIERNQLDGTIWKLGTCGFLSVSEANIEAWLAHSTQIIQISISHKAIAINKLV